MARKTIHRRAGITIVDMTLRASGRRVRAEQWKARFIVIERRRFPGAGRVAIGAGA